MTRRKVYSNLQRVQVVAVFPIALLVMIVEMAYKALRHYMVLMRINFAELKQIFHNVWFLETDDDEHRPGVDDQFTTSLPRDTINYHNNPEGTP
jgi:hypothetical protein